VFTARYVLDRYIQQTRLVFKGLINLLTPNVNYSGRTALPTSKVTFYTFIQQI